MRIHRMTPEQIVTNLQDQADGCPSCQWYGWNNNTTGGKRVCDAVMPAFPHGSSRTCKQWYKPKDKQSKGRGRAR